MKRALFAILAIGVSLACTAKNRPVAVEKLPASAREFMNVNYQGEKISYAFVDDDLIRPDYIVRLVNGVEIVFEHDGLLDKITDKAGVPKGVVPVQITDYVKTYYPDAVVVEYEIGRREYDVKLTNGLELTFNSNFRLRELDN